jgi:hypothetical protein
VSQPAGDRPGEVLPDRCSASQCSIRVSAQSGGLSDGAWFAYRSS